MIFFTIELLQVQTCDQLPCLHELTKESQPGDADRRFNTNFATFKDVAQICFRGSMPCSELLLGFFDFFSNSFDWNNEVVSVRVGMRKSIEADCFQSLWGKGRRPGLHVEDPIDSGTELILHWQVAKHGPRLRNILRTFVQVHVTLTILLGKFRQQT